MRYPGDCETVKDPENYPCGHPRTEENTAHEFSGGHHRRRCRECKRLRAIDYYRSNIAYFRQYRRKLKYPGAHALERMWK